MKKVITFATIFFFFFTNVSGQPWFKNGKFTEDAKRELHRVFGKSMGFTPEETIEYVDSIRINGKYENKKVRNSGVSASGIKLLDVGTYQVIRLGSTDATLLEADKVGHTATLYLKRDCANLDWTLTAPTPVTVAPPAPTPPPAPVVKKEEQKPEPCKPCDWEWDCRNGDKIIHHRHPNWMKCCELVFVGQPCPTVVVVQQRTVCPPPQIRGAYRARAAYRVGCPPKPCH